MDIKKLIVIQVLTLNSIQVISRWNDLTLCVGFYNRVPLKKSVLKDLPSTSTSGYVPSALVTNIYSTRRYIRSFS